MKQNFLKNTNLIIYDECQINHQDIKYNNSKYTICHILYNNQPKLFIIDQCDKDNIIYSNWYYKPNGSYIGHSFYSDQKTKQDLYLHNFIMNKLTFEGKGQQHTIDHINRIGTDNRKCNLRLVESQSAQNFNQKQRARKIELPKNCGFNVDDIPKNIYYRKETIEKTKTGQTNRGEHFEIDIKGISIIIDGKQVNKFRKKSNQIIGVPLIQKLDEVITILTDLSIKHPELNQVIKNKDSEQLRKKLINEYNEILQLSNYPPEIIKQNLTTYINEYKEIEFDKKQIVPTKKWPNQFQKPKYCYFRQESQKLGCQFIIDKRHPQLNNKPWSSTSSKKISLEEKYEQLIDQYKKINIDLYLIFYKPELKKFDFDQELKFLKQLQINKQQN